MCARASKESGPSSKLARDDEGGGKVDLRQRTVSDVWGASNWGTNLYRTMENMSMDQAKKGKKREAVAGNNTDSIAGGRKESSRNATMGGSIRWKQKELPGQSPGRRRRRRILQ